MNLANAAIWQKNAKMLYVIIAVNSGQIPTPTPEQFSYVYTELHSLFASYLLYYTALWSIKLSFLLFFRNLGNDIRRQRIFWYCVLAYTIASYITCIGMIDYKCTMEPGGLGKTIFHHEKAWTDEYTQQRNAKAPTPLIIFLSI